MARDQWNLAALLLATLATHPAESSPTAKESVAFSNGTIPIDEVIALSKLGKDQFEPTSAFDKRRCEAIAKLLGVDISKPVVFRTLPGTRSWYDADRQRFLFENISKAGFPASGFYLILTSREVSGASYVGKTAYGVTKEIKVKEGEYVVLSVPHSSHLVKHLGVVVPMKADQARALSGDLRLEVITKVGPPCISSDVQREDATLDSPVKETKRVYAIRALPGATIWRVVRASTGEVLKTGKPSLD